MSDTYLSIDREAVFPQLRRDQYRKTSNECVEYNCIAHAAGKADNWWWPPAGGDGEGVHWPIDPPEETIEAFILAYETEGYEVCQGHELEGGIEKVAIYIEADGIPSHAARQLPDGSWTSKLGEWEDIQHQTGLVPEKWRVPL